MPRAEKKPLEVISDVVVEPIPVDKAMDKIVAEENFYNEIVVVNFHESTNENDADNFILSVNGINQPVRVGVDIPMRRKFLEVAARCWATSHTQPIRDMQNPEAGNALIGKSALAHPFSVVEDKNPNGRAWLRKILQERT